MGSSLGLQMEISKSCLLIICGCVFNHPEMQWLKTAMLTDRHSGQGLVGTAALQRLPSSGAAARSHLKARLAVTGTLEGLWQECLPLAVWLLTMGRKLQG